MTPKRKRRLMITLLIVTGVSAATGLTLMSLNENINLFYSPSQIAAGEAPRNATFRVGGMVVTGSVARNTSNLDVRFDLTDTVEQVSVHYTGILPDLFREGQGIVALGKLEGTIFRAEQVLAKHDETYMAPEIRDAINTANAGPSTSEEDPY